MLACSFYPGTANVATYKVKITIIFELSSNYPIIPGIERCGGSKVWESNPVGARKGKRGGGGGL